MRLVCPKCGTEYEVSEALVSSNKTVECFRCLNRWKPWLQPAVFSKTEESEGVVSKAIKDQVEKQFSTHVPLSEKTPKASEVNIQQAMAAPTSKILEDISSLAETKIKVPALTSSSSQEENSVARQIASEELKEASHLLMNEEEKIKGEDDYFSARKAKREAMKKNTVSSSSFSEVKNQREDISLSLPWMIFLWISSGIVFIIIAITLSYIWPASALHPLYVALHKIGLPLI